MARGGGIDSLAKAVQELGLEVSSRGTWEVELSVRAWSWFGWVL